MGYEMNFNSSEEIADEIAELTPTFTVSLSKARQIKIMAMQ